MSNETRNRLAKGEPGQMMRTNADGDREWFTPPQGDGSNVLSIEAFKAKQAMNPGEAMAEVSGEKLVNDQLERLMRVLFALVRAQGRVRIARADLEAATGGKLDVKVQENGDLIVSFVGAP